MKKFLVTALLTATVAGGTAQVKNQSHGYPIDPVPFTSVKVTDSFWGQRLNASREVTIPLAFSKCEETGRYTNFVNAAHPSDTIKVGGLAFDDTDVYKTIEGASYLLQTYPDKKLAKYIDSVLVIVAAAQEPDGYLYTSRTMNPKHPHEWAGSKRWEKVEELSHEFYNLGHMVEGAIAHYQATGKRNFLDIAIRYADCVCREIGTGEGQQIRVPGHQANVKTARLYISHFIQVLNLAVIRSEVRIAHKEYYGLDTSNNNVPDLSTEPALAEWGRKIVDGENKRISQGGIPIYNPTIAKVRVHYDIFMDSYEKQKNLQSLTARSLDTLASMRAEADGLILDIWNQVEKKFEEVTPNEKRLDLCRDYGIIYYYRTGEKRKE